MKEMEQRDSRCTCLLNEDGEDGKKGPDTWNMK